MKITIDQLFDNPKRWISAFDELANHYQANRIADLMSTHPKVAGTYRVRRGDDVLSIWVEGHQITNPDIIATSTYTFKPR